jgi:hypothetical protein
MLPAVAVTDSEYVPAGVPATGAGLEEVPPPPQAVHTTTRNSAYASVMVTRRRRMARLPSAASPSNHIARCDTG